MQIFRELSSVGKKQLANFQLHSANPEKYNLFFSRMPRPYRMSVRSGGLEKASNQRLHVFQHCQLSS